MKTMSWKALSIAIILATSLATAFFVRSAVSPLQRGPRIDTLRQKIVRSPAAQLVEMQAGPPTGSDMWQGLARGSDIQDMSQRGKTVSSASGFNYYIFGFNYRRAPLNDVNFRHALAHLVPKDRIAAFLSPVAVRADTPVPRSQYLWFNSNVDPHTYDPSMAEEILGHPQSLYQKSYSGVWQYKTGAPLETVRVYAPLESTSPTSYTIEKTFVEEANKIGLTNVKLEPMDFATYLDLVYNQWDFEIYWVAYYVGAVPTHLWDLFHSGNDFPGGSNPYGISYGELDDLLDILYFSLDRDAQIAAAQRIQELLMGGSVDDPLPTNVLIGDPRQEAIPMLPVYSKVYYDVMQPDLKGAVNMEGYGISNMWTYDNVYWNTPNEYRLGTTDRAVVKIFDDFPERLNPLSARTSYTSSFISPVYDSLMATNPFTQRDLPWLATSWSYVQTAEGMDVTFNLRLTDSQGQPTLWQDGDPISASDVKFSWDFLHDEQIPNYWSFMKFYTSSDIVNGGNTIVAHMTEPSPWHIYSLARVAYMLPPQVWSQEAHNWPQDATRLATILGYDPSANPYPDPDSSGPLQALPTQLFGTGPFINMHSTGTIFLQEFGDLDANRNYWLTTVEIQQRISDMFRSAGDVNSDGMVDTLDMSTIGLAYGTALGDELWNPNADICGPGESPPDGAVNIFDAAMVGKNFGKIRTIPRP